MSEPCCPAQRGPNPSAMKAYLDALAQTVPCRMCDDGCAFPPATLCGVCVAYIRDCEAEASEGR